MPWLHVQLPLRSKGKWGAAQVGRGVQPGRVNRSQNRFMGWVGGPRELRGAQLRLQVQTWACDGSQIHGLWPWVVAMGG